MIVSARLDTINIFDKLEVGLDSPSTGIIALLATAEILYREQNFQLQNGKNVLFAFFHGESFDYIGSTKVFYDMKNQKFPEKKVPSDSENAKTQWPLIDLKSISAHVELGQLMSRANDKFYYHVDSLEASKEVSEALEVSSSASGLDLQKSRSDVLPPGSIQTLLKQRREVPAILLSNFDESYANPYYHSLYDNATLDEKVIIIN